MVTHLQWDGCPGETYLSLQKKKNFLGYYWKHAISFPSVGCSLILSADVFFFPLILYFTLEVFSLLLGFYLILFQLWFLSCWGKILQQTELKILQLEVKVDPVPMTQPQHNTLSTNSNLCNLCEVWWKKISLWHIFYHHSPSSLISPLKT